MRRCFALSASAALLLSLAPAAHAQVLNPHTPAPFTGAVHTYAVHGCGDGYLSAPSTGTPRVQVFCLDGTAAVGVVQGGATYQVVLDLTGTRQNGFAGNFFDADYSAVTLPTAYDFTTGPESGYEGYSIGPDPTGRVIGAYNLGYQPDLIGAGGVSLGSPGLVYLAYTLAGAPRDGASGQGLNFAVTITATPEPATLALTFGGMAGIVVLGALRQRRRQ